MMNILMCRATQSCHIGVHQSNKRPATNAYRTYKYEALKKQSKTKYIKENDTQKDPSVLSVGSTVAVQWKDEGPGMCEFVEEGQSYIIWDMKAGKLIMWSIKHTCSTLETANQYLHEQIKKAAEMLEDIFMQVVPVE